MAASRLISPDIKDWDYYRDYIWPDTREFSGADKASTHGVVGAGILAFILILAAWIFVKLAGLGVEALCCLALAMVWTSIAQGIHRKSMLAASAGLALWVMLAIWVWIEMELFTVLDTAFLTWLFVHGWRGAVRWHEINPSPGLR